jgi:hypothetical protein
MAKSDRNVDYKSKFQDAEQKINKLTRNRHTLRRAVDLGNSLFGSLLGANSTAVARQSSMATDQDNYQTALEAQMVALQAELASYSKHDTTVAEGIIDDVEADAITYNGLHASRLTDLVEVQVDGIQAAIISWFGALGYRSGTPR